MVEKFLDIGSLPTHHTVANEPFKGNGTTLSLTNPKDASAVTSLQAASKEDVDKAVLEADAALKGPWGSYTAAQRAACMFKYADLLDQHSSEIGYFESIVSGKPVQSLGAELAMCSAVFRYYAGWADKIKGDSYPADDGFYKIVRHEPIGVCAGITAWNGSLYFLSWKAGPALACGNTIIIKPSEKSPLGILAAGALIKEAGFPPGVFQVLAGGGDIGAHLASHMGINKISFTGSTWTGRKIQEASAKSNLKRVTLELGGKSPGIVFDDANLDTALFWAVLSITINTGQVCAAQSRLYLHETIAEDFLERLKQRFADIGSSLGADPQVDSTTYGPVIDQVQYEKVRKYIAGGKDNAQLLVGDQDYLGAGFYVAPTIFVNPKEDDAVYKEEVFGPVLCVRTFKTEEDAIAMANASAYGLSASVYTENIKRALRTSAQLRGGTVGVNCGPVLGTQVPMGGFGSSGIGRELGEYALRHYTEPKTICISMT